MLVHYLNLDRRPERNRAFVEANAGLAEFLRVAALDGASLSRDELLAPRFLEENVDSFSAGALGNAASHRRLWQQTSAGNDFLTVAEDDAVFNHRFVSSAEGVLARLPPEWDLILWGWNFDSILHVDLFDGLNDAVLHFRRPTLGPDVDEYRARTIAATPLRLINAFGLVCYSVSPRGAARLLERCFPLNNEPVAVPGLNAKIINMTLDTEMNKHFRSLEAYVAFPPLVWTENDRTQSDVCGEQ